MVDVNLSNQACGLDVETIVLLLKIFYCRPLITSELLVDILHKDDVHTTAKFC